jgi:F420-dependent oxidoreductase-like protein
MSLQYEATNIAKLPARERVGLAIEATDTLNGIMNVREAESAGVRQVWMTILAAGGADTLTAYAAAAAQTSRIKLGTSIVPIYPRHPLVMAQQALCINDIATGRFRLGIGPSHRHIMEQMYGLSMKSPLAYLKEYVAILRDALWEGKVDHHGKYFNVKFTMPRKAQVPILISALGENAFRVAGEISDGAISWMCPIPYLLNKALPALREGAKSSKRPVPPLVAHLPVALTTDMTAARTATRQRLQPYTKMPFYAHMFAEAGTPVAENETGIDALADTLVLAGNEATVKQRLLELLASGLDELLLLPVTVFDAKNERKQILNLIGSL